MTLRALDVLRSVDVIACEDTRHTRTLLARHGIAGRLVSFHKFNEGRAAAGLVSRLTGGESIALVSDGGTPAVSDPGYRLVREALDAGVTVTPVPGPSAFVAAVSASGLPSESIAFRGFLPHRAGERRRLLAAIRDDSATQVFYESPHRIVASLADLAEILGPRQAAVARELTKRFETWYRGTLPDVAARVAEGPIKGEFCLVIEGAGRRKERDARAEHAALGPESSALHHETPFAVADLKERYQLALGEGLDRRQALKRAAQECGLTRKEAYALVHAVDEG